MFDICVQKCRQMHELVLEGRTVLIDVESFDVFSSQPCSADSFLDVLRNVYLFFEAIGGGLDSVDGARLLMKVGGPLNRDTIGDGLWTKHC